MIIFPTKLLMIHYEIMTLSSPNLKPPHHFIHVENLLLQGKYISIFTLSLSSCHILSINNLN